MALSSIHSRVGFGFFYGSFLPRCVHIIYIYDRPDRFFSTISIIIISDPGVSTGHRLRTHDTLSHVNEYLGGYASYHLALPITCDGNKPTKLLQRPDVVVGVVV